MRDKRDVHHVPKNPRISVLVPVHDAERYLVQCLNSLLRQTIPSMEIICIDDGSSDSSAKILAAFARRDPRIHILTHENHGYGYTLNKGLDAAEGDYIGIVESDDWAEPSMFEDLYCTALATDADMAKSNFYMEWTHPKHREMYRCFDKKDDGLIICPREDPQGRLFRKKPTVWSSIYRRSFLDDNRIRFLETPGASFQDTSFNFKALWLAEKVACVTTPYIHYRQDNEASSINSKDMAYCVCREYEEIERFLTGRPGSDLFAAKVLTPMIYDTFIWNYERLGADLKLPFLEEASRWFRQLLAEGRVDWASFPESKRVNFRMIAYAPTVYNAWKRESACQPVHRQTFASSIVKRIRAALPPSSRRFDNKIRSLTRQMEALQATMDALVRQNTALPSSIQKSEDGTGNK